MPNSKMCLKHCGACNWYEFEIEYHNTNQHLTANNIRCVILQVCNTAGLHDMQYCRFEVHKLLSHRVRVCEECKIKLCSISNKLEHCQMHGLALGSDNVRILDITLPYSVP